MMHRQVHDERAAIRALENTQTEATCGRDGRSSCVSAIANPCSYGRAGRRFPSLRLMLTVRSVIDATFQVVGNGLLPWVRIR